MQQNRRSSLKKRIFGAEERKGYLKMSRKKNWEKLSKIDNEKLKLASEIICEISERADLGIVFFVCEEDKPGEITGVGGVHNMNRHMTEAAGAFLLNTPLKKAMDNAEDMGLSKGKNTHRWKNPIERFMKNIKD